MIRKGLEFFGYASTSFLLVLLSLHLFYPDPQPADPLSGTKIEWVSSSARSANPSGPLEAVSRAGEPGTGIMEWQACDEKTDPSRCRWEDFPLRTWEGARTHCQELSQEKNEAWRLPTLQETDVLSGLRFIRSPTSYGLWTSERVRNYPGFAWVRDVKTGIPNPEPESSLFLVRCVRSPSPDGNRESDGP